MADSPDPVVAGEGLTYTLVLSNQGPSDASGVVVTDTLPEEVVYSTANPSPDGTDPLVWDLGSLAAGTSQTLTVVVSVDAGAVGPLSSQAAVSSQTSDPAFGNNSAVELTTVTTQADLGIEMAVFPDPVLAGETITYSLTISNLGPSDAISVSVTDTLPAGVTFIISQPVSIPCRDTSGVLVCDVGGIPAHGSTKIDILAQVSSSSIGPIQNIAGVSGAETDPQLGNNSAARTITVGVSTDLSIDVVGQPDPVIAGELITYTLLVANDGPGDASNVVVTDTLPGGVGYLSSQPACTQSNGTVFCDEGVIAAGDSVQIRIHGRVDPAQKEAIENTASVGAGDPDPDDQNNQSFSVVAVTASSDLLIAMTSSPDSGVAGELITFTLIVTNEGPSLASGVSVTDVIPAGVNFISAVPPLDGANPPRWDLGELNAGDPATISVLTSVAADTRGTLTNRASASSLTMDPITENNMAESAFDVIGQADLSISTIPPAEIVYPGEIIHYTLQIANDGPSDATGVTIADNLVGQIKLLTWRFDEGVCNLKSGKLTCNLDSLTAHASVQIKLDAQVDNFASGAIQNTSSVTAVEVDPEPVGNASISESLIGIRRVYLPIIRIP